MSQTTIKLSDLAALANSATKIQDAVKGGQNLVQAVETTLNIIQLGQGIKTVELVDGMTVADVLEKAGINLTKGAVVRSASGEKIAAPAKTPAKDVGPAVSVGKPVKGGF